MEILTNQTPEVKINQAKVWFPFYAGDYAADTLDFNAAEHGCYLLLIIHYWRNGAFENNLTNIKTLCRVSGKGCFRRLYKVLSKFTLKDGFYHHKRIDEELEKANNNIRLQVGRTKNAREALQRKRSVTVSVTDTVTVSSSPSSSPISTNSTNISTPKALPSSVADGYVWFRISDSEMVLVKAYYTKNQYPLDLIPHAMDEVEQWLANGSKSGSRRARKNPTHFKHLYASWVLDNAFKKRSMGKPFPGQGQGKKFEPSGSLVDSKRINEAIKEKGQQVFKEMREIDKQLEEITEEKRLENVKRFHALLEGKNLLKRVSSPNGA